MRCPSPIAAFKQIAVSQQPRHDVFGEFEWRVLLEARLDDAVAEGWGGDRMVAYADQCVNLSTWDTELDAIQMDAAPADGQADRQAGGTSNRPTIYERAAS